MQLHHFSSFLLFLLFSVQLTAQQFPNANLKNLERQQVELSDYVGQGKNTVVAIWATSCPNCIMELDHIKDYTEKWAAEYNAEVIAISMDQYQRVRRIQPLVSRRQWPYTILIDSQRQLGQLLNFSAIPQLFVIDKHGKIIKQYGTYQRGREIEVDRLLSSLR